MSDVRLTEVQKQALADCAAGEPYRACIMRLGRFALRARVIGRLIGKGLLTSRDSVTLTLTPAGRAALASRKERT